MVYVFSGKKNLDYVLYELNLYTKPKDLYLVIQNYYTQYNKEEFKNKVRPLVLFFFLASLARDRTCALGSQSVES